jgi:hypothetical protein
MEMENLIGGDVTPYTKNIILNFLKGGINNMKKITSLFLIVFLLVGTLGFVVAEEEEALVPEAKKIGFFENRMDRIKLAFTFNKEKKIEKALEMAEKRLAEAELLAEENPEAYERAQERYDELVKRAEKILENLESEAEDEEDSLDNIERIARIQNQFERHRDHADEIYSRVRERFEENNASDEKIERFEMFYERAINRSYKMEERILEKRDNAVLKHKALSEMSDEDLEELLVKVEEGEGLIQAREARMERFEERTEKLEEKGIEQRERVLKYLENGNFTEEEMERINERIQNSEQRLEEMRERNQERFEAVKERNEERTRNLTEAIEEEIENRKSDIDDSENSTA